MKSNHAAVFFVTYMCERAKSIERKCDKLNKKRKQKKKLKNQKTSGENYSIIGLFVKNKGEE